MRWSIFRVSLLLSVLALGLTFGFRKNKPEPKPESAQTTSEEEGSSDSETGQASKIQSEPDAPALFEAALPIAIQSTPTGLANISAQGCNACHQAACDDWQDSAHSQAWKRETFQTAITHAGDSTLCTGCHLPLTNQHANIAVGYLEGDASRPDLRPNNAWDPTLMTEGVTCAACHVREQDQEDGTSRAVVIASRPVKGAPHPTAYSTELSSSEMCATCHQLTWPEADKPFYDTYGEWSKSAYAAAGVQCQDCHMPPKASAALATHFASSPAHTWDIDPTRAVSLLIKLDTPVVQRGEAFTVQSTLQNTGAGHHFPTGSPYKTYRITTQIVGAEQGPLTEAMHTDLGRKIEDAPPWNTLEDNRIAAGDAMTFEQEFVVKQSKKAQKGLIRVTLERMVGDSVSETDTLQEIPISIR